jgi:Fe2+ or Zn2+ uptake regulation protein
MKLTEGQSRIFNIVIDKTKRTLTTAVHDTAIIEASGLPSGEVYEYLSQLEGLGLITIDQKMSGATSRLVRITKDGLQATSEDQELL